jgi:hypothetical protein
MLELIFGVALLGSIVASAMTPAQKPKPKKLSDSIKGVEAMLIIAVLDKSLNDDDREKINKAIEALKA